MPKRADVLVALGIVLIAAGLVSSAVLRVRETAARLSCKNNLHAIGWGLITYHDQQGFFPPGTLPNESLPPEKRLSWYVESWAYVGDGQIGLRIDKTKAWDSETNRIPMGYSIGGEDFVLNMPMWQCPSNARTAVPGEASHTHYVGIAGLGLTAAELPLHYPLAGVFGYDRKTRISDMQHGLSTTMMVVETANQTGPWTAGGFATLRGLDPDGRVYIGKSGQFASGHRHGSNALFADGSARFLKDSTEPKLFEAMATIAGRENVERIGDD